MPWPLGHSCEKKDWNEPGAPNCREDLGCPLVDEDGFQMASGGLPDDTCNVVSGSGPWTDPKVSPGDWTSPLGLAFHGHQNPKMQRSYEETPHSVGIRTESKFGKCRMQLIPRFHMV